MSLTSKQIERYSRQIIVPDVGGIAQERLLASRIVLFGDAADVESPLSYLVGAGVGRIELALNASTVRELTDSMKALNHDVTIAALDDSLSHDLGFAIVGSRRAVTDAADSISRSPRIPWIVARLDEPARIAILPSKSPCPRCIDGLFSRFGSHAANHAVVAMAATTEVISLLAKSRTETRATLIEFNGYASRAYEIEANPRCECGKPE